MQLKPATHGQVLAFVWRYVKSHKLLLSAMITALLMRTGFMLVQPFFYRELVDSIVESPGVSAEIMRHVFLMGGFGVLCGMAGLTCLEFSSYLLANIETRVMRETHSDVFAHVQRLSTQFHVNAFAGATSRKITRGTSGVENILDSMWFNFLPLALAMLGFFGALWYLSPIMGVAVLVCMLVYIPISVGQNLYLMRFTRWTDRQDTRVTASLIDSIVGHAAVKTFSAEGREDQRHGGVIDEWRKRALKTWHISTCTAWTHSMLMMFIEGVLLATAIWLWYRGTFTPGSFVVVFFFVGMLWGYMRDIGRQVRTYLHNVAHAEEMVGLYHTPAEVADKKSATKLHVPKGAIALRNVTFSYDQSSGPIFKDLTLDIEAGEKIALVGHSGGGKSTFVKILQRLYDIQAGRILIDGQDIVEVTQGSLREEIGLVPQDPILFHRTLSENIAYGKPSATQSEIISAAKKAHAHEFISSLPREYETLVGERGVKLSGGERQRVAIARAILADTPILILDEATSSLDSMSEKYIQEALLNLMEGRTTIAIAHRLSTIKHVDRILVFEDGKIVEEGNHASLTRRKGSVYRSLYELQAGGFIGE